MGFGYGYSSRSDHGGKRYNNSQVAHVWNAQTERRGQSNNGNVYFEGAALYSYGSHFLTGYIMPDGVALLNADSYSVSTNQHQSDARSAVSNRDTFTIAGLTELRDMLQAITAENRSAARKCEARDIIRKHAESLAAARRYRAGASDNYEWLDSPDPETGRSYRVTSGAEPETAGEYLTRLAGLPAASWPKLQREAAKAKAKREAESAKRERESKLAAARRLADLPESEWRRRGLAILNPYHNAGFTSSDADQRLKRLGLELLRAVKTANAEGFSKRRRETLKRRRKEAAARMIEAAAIEAILNKRRNLRSDIALVRALADEWRGRDELPADYWRLRALGDGAEALKRLGESHAFRQSTRQRLRFQATRLAATATRLQEEHGRLAEERHAREAELRAMKAEEQRRLWIAGEAPLVNRFDAESGGAALRIKGNRLETSHGADVPLADAIRAFRFIKLCREAGREWKANGQQVRVGAFRLDWIDSDGNMKAGCHFFTWPEIERAAALAGVADDPASAEAVRDSKEAA
jgi:hypothetical protein